MKNIDKQQLKIVSMEFRAIANRLINCNRDTGMPLLKKFIAYIDNNEIISEYIQGYTKPGDFQPVEAGTTFTSMGDTEQEEVSYTYQYLKYATENFTDFDYNIAYGYARNINDSIKEFCHRIVLPFVNYIENYLVQVGIKMNYDEDAKYTITVNGGVAQVNVANDDAKINAKQNSGIDITQLENILSDVIKAIPHELDTKSQEEIRDSLEVIKDEVMKPKPRKGFMEVVLKYLSGINTTTQFAAAVATLVQFIGTIQ